MLNAKLVDQLTAVKGLLLRKFEDFVKLKIFLMFSRVVAWSARTHGKVESQRRIDPLCLVKHLLLHVEMLLQVGFPLFVLLCSLIRLI